MLEPGTFEVWEAGDDSANAGYTQIEAGTMSVANIPLCTVYGQKMGVLFSRPPLLPVAALNISHYQKSSDLMQSLHVAAQPILIGAGMDDLTNGNTSDSAIGLSVNNMLLTSETAKVYYVQPQAQAFQAQRDDMDRLVDEMKNLGIAILADQSNQNQSGLSKAMDRIDSNSVLSVISKSLQQCLQDAVELAAEYAGREPCEVMIPRDFDLQPLEGQELTSVNNLFNSGLIDQETALQILKQGEFLPDDVEIDEIISQTENEELQDLDMQVKRTEAMAEIGEGTPAATEEI